MKIRIIGAVAAGTSAAAKARRNDRSADITIYEKGHHISYAGCSIPYYLAGDVTDISQLAPRSPEFFQQQYGVDVMTRHEVIRINRDRKKLSVKRLEDGSVFEDHYDKLILATGARPVKLPLPGSDLAGVMVLRTLDHMLAFEAFIDEYKPRHAAIVGSGFIGLEMTEALVRQGISVTLIEKLPHLDPALDEDMAPYLVQELEQNRVRWLVSAEVTGFHGKDVVDGVLLADGTVIPAELVLVAAGIKPETTLASQSGLQLGHTGAISVDHQMTTSDPAILACGDCTESCSVIDKMPLYVPLGSTANKTGRIAGDAATGGRLSFAGIAGTGVFRLFGLTVAMTGYSERLARKLGYDAVVSQIEKHDKTRFLGGRDMALKVIAEAGSGKLLGAQIIGPQGVDKRIDVMATAISFGATAADLTGLDLAYAPPFSTAREPVHFAGMLLEKAMKSSKQR